MAAKKEATNGTAKVSKSAFIRSFPETVKAQEIVEQGKAQGLDFTANHVSAVRSIARAKAAKGQAKKERAKPGPKPRAKAAPAALAAKPANGRRRGRPPAAAKSSDADREFVRLACDIGLHHAQELLRQARQTVLG